MELPLEYAPPVTLREKVAAAAHRRKSKGKRNSTGQETFAFHCRSYQLPTPICKEITGKQFTLLNSVQTPRADGKAIPNVWRFDFAWPDWKLIVEVDGGIWTGGAHGHPVDITRNMAKRNDAARDGFHLLSFTPQQVKRGDAIAFTQLVLASKGWKRDAQK